MVINVDMEEIEMLILTRKIGESLVIGEAGEIRAIVLGVKGNQVRIGLEAPQEIPVHREEIYQRIQQKKQNSNISGNEADE